MFCCLCYVGLVLPGAGRVCGQRGSIVQQGWWEEGEQWGAPRRLSGQQLCSLQLQPRPRGSAPPAHAVCAPGAGAEVLSVLAEPGLTHSLVPQAGKGQAAAAGWKKGIKEDREA